VPVLAPGWATAVSAASSAVEGPAGGKVAASGPLTCIVRVRLPEDRYRTK
jgi:hypothetical protein